MTRPLKSARARFLLRPLNLVFGAPSHVALVRALAQSARALTGREAARSAGVAQRAALDALGRLETTGIVHKTPAGRAYLYELDRRHRLVDRGLLPLLEEESNIRAGILRRLRDAVGRDAVSGWIFGSAARGEESPESDLDVLVLVERRSDGEAVRKRVSRVFDALERDLRIRPSLLMMTRAEFVRGHRAARPFMRNVLRDAETFAGRTPKSVVDG